MKKILLVLLCIALIALAALFASSHPDGLEWVAEGFGFAKAAETGVISAPMPDYNFLPIKSPFWSTLFAGTVGAAICFILFWLAARLFKRSDRF